jgi:predicted kinase
VALTLGVPAIAIVFDLPQDLHHFHNKSRPDRRVAAEVIDTHSERLRFALDAIKREPFQQIIILDSAAAVAAASFQTGTY